MTWLGGVGLVWWRAWSPRRAAARRSAYGAVTAAPRNGMGRRHGRRRLGDRGSGNHRSGARRYPQRRQSRQGRQNLTLLTLLTCLRGTSKERPMAIQAGSPTDDDALDAYSQVVTRVSDRLLPSVASLKVMHRVRGGRRAEGSGSAVLIT